MPKFRLSIACLSMLLLAACAPSTETRRQDVAAEPSQGKEARQPSGPAEAEQAPVPSEEPPVPREAKRPQKSAGRVAPSRGSAVLALMNEADTDSASGRLDNAAATLERAIRIEPRNAVLWGKLAEVRLRQQQPGLAEDLAKKSNLLGQGDKALVRKNWSIIAEARRKKGDAEGASEAEARAKR